MTRQLDPTGDRNAPSPDSHDVHASRTTAPTTRRALLSVGGGALATAGLTGFAGCLGSDADGGGSDGRSDGGDEANTLPDLPRVENPPDGVYVPTHREAMEHLPTQRVGEFAVTPMITYPHRFWLVTGQRVEEVLPESSRGVHLMFTPWDPETETVLPVDAGAQIRVSRDGEAVDQRAPWPMLSQSMGFHFGDNVPLPGDGTYTVEIELTPIATRKTGGFDGRFEEGATATFEFEYDEPLRRRLIDDVRYFDEELWGQLGAIEPMDPDHGSHGDDGGHGDGETDDHDETEITMPYSRLPAPEEYPGVAMGEPRTGDARVVVRSLRESRLADGDDYLLVSPRTPYNAVPLADTAISVAGAVEGNLTQTLDDELGLHYGIPASLSPGDTVEVRFDSPPQVSRHAGYETAFIDMPPVEVSIPE
ncbi:iron transporter [Halorubrum sp. DTA46]|uniref:iron transporter n=1 Tax=Halorubrum sp. DTA46 TaxID=3402162 RepID=UPI003AADC6B3